ncbi:hypothetical protein [Streptomyces sp. NPDC097981]|uniref:hypothetical protein n=1 Tax=Streptomyces sp. NPDC097981 TaxID=3155428 RepID=UPI003320F6CE
MSDTRARLAHTSQLGADVLGEVRALPDEAFDGEFSDEDFEHAPGGDVPVGARRRGPAGPRRWGCGSTGATETCCDRRCYEPLMLGAPVSMCPV